MKGNPLHTLTQALPAVCPLLRIILKTIYFYCYTQQSNGRISEDGSVEDFEGIEILPTDLYVRFLPKDSIQYTVLLSDTTIMFHDKPLDYEV